MSPGRARPNARHCCWDPSKSIWSRAARQIPLRLPHPSHQPLSPVALWASKSSPVRNESRATSRLPRIPDPKSRQAAHSAPAGGASPNGLLPDSILRAIQPLPLPVVSLHFWRDGATIACLRPLENRGFGATPCRSESSAWKFQRPTIPNRLSRAGWNSGSGSVSS